MTGHNSMKMSDLSGLYVELGFKDVETFIQSGNVLFRTPSENSESATAGKIEKSIKQRFGYDVPVMIRNIEELRVIFSSNPFTGEEKFDPARTAVILLHEIPSEDQIQRVIKADYPPDKFKIIGREIFIFCPNGFGRSKIYTNFFENKMGVTGTARNWKTISTILNIAEIKTAKSC
jgi:uncharacterized protein (DUF1697 family)